MFKKLSEFVIASITLVIGYILYFAVAAICTFVFGLPIALGVHTIIRAIQLLFTGA